MLLQLRGGLNSIFVTILLSVLILAFAIWGIGPGILQGAGDTVAEVDDVEISTQQFFTTVQRRAQQFQVQFPGFDDTESLIETLNLDRQILAEMLSAARVAAHTDTLGLRPSDTEVAAQILDIDAFKLAGTFSESAMRQTLATAGLTEDQFYTEIRRDVARIQLIEAMTEGGKSARDLAETLYIYDQERRTARLMTIRSADITETFTADDDKLEAFYAASKDAYQTPERRSYRYVLITPAVYAAAQSPTEDDIQRVYEDNADKYIVEELRGLQQVTLADEDAVAQFQAALAAGTDFVEAAVAASSFSAEEIDLGDLSRRDIASDFDDATAEAVFTLDSGAVSPPLPGIAGINIFKVTSIFEGSEIPLSDVRDEVEALARNELAIDAMFDALPDINDLVLDGTPLDAVAEQLSLNLAAVTGVDARGQGEDGSVAVTSAEEAAILQRAFQIQMEDPSELIDLDPGDNQKGVFVVELLDVQDPEIPDFETVRDRVAAAWQTEQRDTAAATKADAALARVRAGEDFASVADSIDAVTFDVKNAARTGGSDSQLTPAIRRLVFDLDQEAADVERSTDGYVIVQVTDIKPGDIEAGSAEVTAKLTALENAISNDLVFQYQNWLTETYPGSVNQAIVDQLFRGSGATNGALR